MCKGKPKTMRFEEDVEAYIEKQKGDNFTDKFHTLVRYCRETEKQRNDTIKRLDKEIENREKRLRELNEKLSSVGWLEQAFSRLKDGIEATNRALNNVIQK